MMSEAGTSAVSGLHFGRHCGRAPGGSRRLSISIVMQVLSFGYQRKVDLRTAIATRRWISLRLTANLDLQTRTVYSRHE